MGKSQILVMNRVGSFWKWAGYHYPIFLNSSLGKYVISIFVPIVSQCDCLNCMLTGLWRVTDISCTWFRLLVASPWFPAPISSNLSYCWWVKPIDSFASRNRLWWAMASDAITLDQNWKRKRSFQWYPDLSDRISGVWNMHENSKRKVS